MTRYVGPPADRAEVQIVLQADGDRRAVEVLQRVQQRDAARAAPPGDGVPSGSNRIPGHADKAVIGVTRLRQDVAEPARRSAHR